MRYIRLALWVVAAGLVASPLLAAPAPQEAEPDDPEVPEAAIEPKDDPELKLLLHYLPGHPEARQKVVQRALAVDRPRLLAFLAHAILDLERGHHYLEFAAEYCRDGRLVPFVVERIRRAADQGQVLLLTVRRLQAWPDPAFVPVLIEHGLSSDYEGRGGSSLDQHTWSVLAETTRLLDKITAGTSGIGPVSATELLGAKDPAARKAELRGQWRAWWTENKETWVSQKGAAGTETPPSQGKTITAVKPKFDDKSDDGESR